MCPPPDGIRPRSDQEPAQPGASADSAQPLQDIVSLQSFIVGVHHPCTPPPHLQSLPFCNTIARPLGNIRPLTDPPCVCREPYNIGDGNFV